jgi:pimeloyl-ACP methyl ester carboxylesterase
VSGYSTGQVRSTDGTVIDFRRYGAGPALVLLHGGMKAAQHLASLADALGDTFTVVVPDRRGRGASGPHGPDFTVAREVEDVAALLSETGARLLFGHSSGGLVALRAAHDLPDLDRVALFEPPLSVGGSVPVDWVPRYDREVAAGRPVAALLTALTATGLAPGLARLPRFLLAPLLATALRLDRPGPHAPVTIRELVPTQHYDMRIVADLADTAADHADLATPVLLLGGTRGPAYLRTALAELDRVLPHAHRRTIDGADHEAPENDGMPQAIAAALRTFFLAP